MTEEERNEEGGATMRKSVGRTKWKKCWQAGCCDGGKVGQPHSCVLASRDPPKIGVTVFYCQGEEREGNTGDVVMCRERARRRIGVRQEKK